ncbi:hypothetical protein [Pedobacter sp. Leaf250]|uniref:hypothetical protein n=1 Tax=Pedobacter sp. Leaf250 TaxID=2876559 RepID=UPI001E53C87A|nr:hypothetical protein [Pedobacter sp. Leaf250]
MKNLLIALVLIFTGTSTYAANMSHIKSTPVSSLISEITTSNEIKVSLKENKNIALFRRQMCFTFTDLCGQTLQVWVSGPSSASNYDLWHTALDYSHSPSAMSWGCFK